MKYYPKMVAALLCALVAGSAAKAADPLVVALGHAQLLRFAKPATRVVIGDPQVADVTVDTPKLLTVIGKKPGSTNLLVLGNDDRTLYVQRIVVAESAESSVEVHVPTNDGPMTRVYDCGEARCVRVPAAQGGGSAALGAVAAAGGAAGMGSTAPPPAK